MVPRHLRTIARQQSAEATGYMILGDGTRIPVASLMGEYLEHLRIENKRCFADSVQHLFVDKPRANSEYKHDFADRIGDIWLSARWTTSSFDPNGPKSSKWLSLGAPGWALNEYVSSGSIYNYDRNISLTLIGKSLPDSLADALIGRPMSEVIDLPEPFKWTRNLKIAKIQSNEPKTETTLTFLIEEQPQASIIRTFPDPDMEKAADRLIAQVQKVIRQGMKLRGLNHKGLADKAGISEKILKEVFTKGGEGPDLRMIARLFHAMGMVPRIEVTPN